MWSKADIHIHSDHSDGLAKIPQIMEYVQNHTDLDVIAITDHNTIEGSLFAQSLSELYARTCSIQSTSSAGLARPGARGRTLTASDGYSCKKSRGSYMIRPSS